MSTGQSAPAMQRLCISSQERHQASEHRLAHLEKKASGLGRWLVVLSMQKHTPAQLTGSWKRPPRHDTGEGGNKYQKNI